MLFLLTRAVLVWSEFECHVDFPMAEDGFVDATAELERQTEQEA